MSGNLAVSTINGEDISVSPVATQAYSNSLLYEYTVTGSAVTSIDFSGLDINTHKSYRVDIEINSVATADLYLFINGDTVTSNYSATAASTARAYPELAVLNISTRTIANGNIFKNNSYADASFLSCRSNGYNQHNNIRKTATVTNITQLTFTSSVASAIGVGSKIRIYRGDV